MIPHIECSTRIFFDVFCGRDEITCDGASVHDVVNVLFKGILSYLKGAHRCGKALSGGGAGGSGPSAASASSLTHAVTTSAASSASSYGGCSCQGVYTAHISSSSCCGSFYGACFSSCRCCDRRCCFHLVLLSFYRFRSIFFYLRGAFVVPVLSNVEMA